MAKKGCQNALTKIFAIEKLSAAVLFSLLVGYELISYYYRANQITEYVLNIRWQSIEYKLILREAASRREQFQVISESVY